MSIAAAIANRLTIKFVSGNVGERHMYPNGSNSYVEDHSSIQNVLIVTNTNYYNLENFQPLKMPTRTRNEV